MLRSSSSRTSPADAVDATPAILDPSTGRRGAVGRRAFLGLLAVTPLVALAACGDDDGGATPATQPAPDSTLPAVDEGYQHPTGADEVVLRIGYEGGFVTPEMTFVDLPTLLVTGDRLFQQGPVIAIYPGPLLPNIQQRTITEDGIQELLALADEYGLLQEREYEAPQNIADAPDTVVTVTVGGITYEHRAYALGLADPSGTESDADRAALAAFVQEATTFATQPAGDVLGSEEPFVAETYLVRSFPVTDTSGYDVEPTIVEWPADAPVALADAADCASLPADQFRSLFESANQLTFFDDEGVTYQLAVKPQLPGDAC